MTGRRPGAEGFRRRGPGPAQRLSLAVQVAVVCTGLVIGLIPLTAPLPPLGATVTGVVVGAVVLTASVAVLGFMLLVPAAARFRTRRRVVTAAALGAVAAGWVYAATAGLATRPLLLVATAALVWVLVDSAVQHRRR